MPPRPRIRPPFLGRRIPAPNSITTTAAAAATTTTTAATTTTTIATPPPVASRTTGIAAQCLITTKPRVPSSSPSSSSSSSSSSSFSPRYHYSTSPSPRSHSQAPSPSPPPPPPPPPPNSRWHSDLLARVGRCIIFGCGPAQVARAAAILRALATEWRALAAGSEGFLTGGRRGMEGQQVVWGEQDSFVGSSCSSFHPSPF